MSSEISSIFNDLLIFGFFDWIIFMIDINTNPCIINEYYKSDNIYVLLYLHHFLSLFVKFGFLVQSRLLLFFLFIYSVIRNYSMEYKWRQMCLKPDYSRNM
jgi:hypothetical protein